MLEIRIKPTPAQDEFLESKARFTLFSGGVGAGKTHIGAFKSFLVGSKAVCTGMAVAPTYRMLKDSTLIKFQEIAEDVIAEYIKSDMIIVLENGTRILFRSAEDPDHLRGVNLNFIWYDEASYMKEQAWFIGIARLRETAYTQEGEPIKPCAFITCTPKGQNWLYQEFVKRHGLGDGYKVIRTSTYENAENLDADYIASLEAGYSGKYFAQEVKGEFVLFEGLVYDMFREDIHIWPRDTELPKFGEIAYGLDYGYTNPTAISVHGLIRQDTRRFDIQIDELYERGLDHADVVLRMREFYRIYGQGRVYCDPSEPALIEALQKGGIDAIGADNDVRAGIQKEQAALKVIGGKAGAYIVDTCIHTKAEFASYCWKTRGKGENMRYLDEPDKAAGNDHLMDARRYCRMGVSYSVSMPVFANG